MKEIKTDHWSLLIPTEWLSEQDEETIIIQDPDAISSLEITTILPTKGNNLKSISDQMTQDKRPVQLSGLQAFYHEFKEDGEFWREWICLNEHFILLLSHGCEQENQGYDDAIIDEIIATLLYEQAK